MIAEFIIYVLATWRIASLLATEEGPFGIFSKLRQGLGVYYKENAQGVLVPYADNVIGKGIICIWCSSIWFGLLFTTLTLIAAKTTFYIALPLAISAGAVIVNGIIEWHEQAHQRS